MGVNKSIRKGKKGRTINSKSQKKYKYIFLSKFIASAQKYIKIDYIELIEIVYFGK